jgi:hypothetical protein
LGVAAATATAVSVSVALLVVILLIGKRGVEERSMYGCGRRAYGRIILLP